MSDILLKHGIASDWQANDYWLGAAWRVYKRSVYENKDLWMFFLNQWCGGKPQFIREFAFPSRRVATTTNQIHKQLLYFGCEKRNSCYLTIYEFTETKMASEARKRSGQSFAPVYESALVNRIAFDFDQAELCPMCLTKVDIIKKSRVCPKCKWSTENSLNGENVLLQSLYDVWREVQDVWDMVGRASVVFTGGRGFQMRFPMDVPCDNYHDIVTFVKSTQQHIHDKTKTLSLDTGHFGDLARVYRIPYSLHHKRLRFCIPVKPGEELDKIHERSLALQMPEPIEYIDWF